MPSKNTYIAKMLQISQSEPKRIFARYGGIFIHFDNLENASAAYSLQLKQNGIKKQTRVAVMMRNSPASLAMIYAIARLGAVWVPVNTALKGGGLNHIIADSDPVLIVADHEFEEIIKSVTGGTDRKILTILERALPQTASKQRVDELPDLNDLAAIMYTSGTTGPAKGVMVTHTMLNLAAEAVSLCAAIKPDDNFYMWEPFFHIGGAQVLLLPVFYEVSLTISDRFSATKFWDELRECQATHIHHLGGIIQILLKQPVSERDHDHNVRICWGGGCPVEAWRAFEQRFNVQIRECYGMTEASSLSTYNDLDVVGAVGRPMPWFSVRLVDDEGKKVEKGKGEIVLTTSRPGAIFPGYFRNPQGTQKALRADGFYTGDLGEWDDHGNLFFHGRKTDSVRCKGENVSCFEVENTLNEHEMVEACAMIGVASDMGEQDIKIFIQCKAGENVDAESLITWLEPRLAKYQLPRYIAFVDSFERTPSQRIMKHKLSTSTTECYDRLKVKAA